MQNVNGTWRALFSTCVARDGESAEPRKTKKSARLDEAGGAE